ncbi:MAG: TolC family protein [Bacteriovoracaceae bacterium]
MLKFCLAALVTAAFSLNSWGQGPKVLSEAEVVRLALERNEINAISRNELQQAELRLKKARSYLFPTLKANAVIQKLYIVPEKRLPGGLQINQGNITLSQPLYTFGRLTSGIEIANLDKDLTANSVTTTKAEVIKTARQLYYNALFHKHVLQIAEDSIANANRNKGALNERVSFGRINQNDNLKMQADVASRRPLQLETKKSYEAALEELASFLNYPREEIQNLGELTKLDQRMPSKGDVDDFVDVKAAEKNVRLAAAQKELAKSDYMPTLSAFASYTPSHTPTDVALPGVLLTDTAAFGLRLDFDFPLGGAKVYDTKIQTIGAESALLNLQRIKRDVSKQQRSLLQQYETLSEVRTSLKNAVDLADRAYKVALQSFRTGNVSQLQLNDSELLLTRNKISLAQNTLQMKVIETELERLQTQGSR